MSDIENVTGIPEVEEYAALDLSPQSAAYERLMSGVDAEAASGEIVLSGDGTQGDPGPNMSSHMISWLSEFVGPQRRSAVEAIAGHCDNIEVARGARGEWIDLKIDDAKRARAQRRVAAVNTFRIDNHDLVTELDAVSQQYERIKAEEGDRDATVPNLWVEFGLLSLLIMPFEGMLNFESFRQTPIIRSDMMALGSTVLVGLFVLFGSWAYGRYLRSRHYYTQPANPKLQGEGWSILILGTTLLTISLGIVAAARYYYILPEIEAALIDGREPPNIPMTIGSLVLGNFGCFVAGVIATFFMNDQNPEFQKAGKKKKSLKAKYDRIYKSQVARELDVAEQRFNQDRDAAEARRRQMVGKPGFEVFQRESGRLKATDEKVLGILRAYRAQLGQKVQAAGGKTRIYKPNFDNVLSDERERVTAGALSNLPLFLYLRG
jgi:hypothetical protein